MATMSSCVVSFITVNFFAAACVFGFNLCGKKDVIEQLLHVHSHEERTAVAIHSSF